MQRHGAALLLLWPRRLWILSMSCELPHGFCRAGPAPPAHLIDNQSIHRGRNAFKQRAACRVRWAIEQMSAKH